MPTISMFYGILIQMFWDEHAPPHFHATYGEYKATIDIYALTIREGALPRRATQLVLDWTELHQAELIRNWELCRANHQPQPIAPLK
ncbi:transcriptional regulator [Chromatium weissei]|nr:transcriptional regulator [Chromatium weissei]